VGENRQFCNFRLLGALYQTGVSFVHKHPIELKVNEPAQEKSKDAGDIRFFFESTGRKDKSEPIRLERGNQYKGQLHYVAELLPAFTLQDVKFETGPNEL
jgi:hypothetical protein